MVRKTRVPLSPRVLQVLAQLGADLKDIRRRRRMPMAYVCECASISRSTLHKVERGDPGVSLGIYATVLAKYGLIERRARLPRRILSCQVSSRPHPTTDPPAVPG
jgi:transcriptional regulator with XRE-family HTH domain